MCKRFLKPRPLSPKSEIIQFFSHQAKPWSNKQERFYTWRTSIPEKWLDLKGQRYFRHVSEVQHPPLSVDIFQSPEKYLKHFRGLSQKSMEKVLNPKVEEATVQKESQNGRRASLPSREIAEVSPEKSVLIQGKSMPNISMNGTRPMTCGVGNKGIDEFMNRFERKGSIRDQPMANKGLFGWKLKQLEKRRREKKKDYLKIFNVRKATDNVFSELSSRRGNSAG
jgi:hypothetical protein